MKALVTGGASGIGAAIVARLEHEGYDVVATASGEAALEHVRSEPFDLLLTDLRMEGMSGVELMAEVRKRWPDTPSIMLTGYASLDSAIEALREGAYDYLIKPTHVDVLKAAVARGVERGTLARSLRERVSELDEANAKLRAFYYVRVIEIPSPRWTAYDAKRFGVKPLPGTRMTITERAYTSPIWFNPAK